MVDIPHHRWHHELVAHGERRVWETAWKGRRAVTRLLRATHPQARPAPHLGPAIRDALFANGALPDVEDEGLRDALAGHAARARVLGADPRWPTILDAGVTRDGALYFTTSWVEGDALDTCLDRLDDAARRRLLGEVAGLLTDLHARGGVYGDLKASNLVWDARRGVGIIDLETLRTVKGAFDHVATPAATQNWAAPEQTRSRWTFQASDLYAWAVLAERAWPSGLPPMLAFAVRACKRDEPFARPTAASLQASLADPFLALRDARERVISLDTGADARSSAGDEPTDRTPRGGAGAEPTDRTPRGGAGAEPTDRTPRAGAEPTDRTPRAGAEPMDRTPRGTVGEVPRKGAAPPVAVPSRGNVYDRVIGGLLVVLALLSVLVYRRLQTSDAPTSVELAPSTSVAPVTPVAPVARIRPPRRRPPRRRPPATRRGGASTRVRRRPEGRRRPRRSVRSPRSIGPPRLHPRPS